MSISTLISRGVSPQITTRFAPTDRAAAAALISGLIESYRGREIERVVGMVLAIANGDLASLADAVRLAQGDHRDVLALEGFTGAGKLRSEPAPGVAGAVFRGARHESPQGPAVDARSACSMFGHRLCLGEASRVGC